MKIAIGIPTYKRADGTTPMYLTRALESVLSQTHQDFKIFLIGDDYEDQEEFERLASIVPADKIHAENLDVAVERSKYPVGSKELWCSGGVNAYNRAIDLCLESGYDYMCHLDHDDYWSNNHLELIANVIAEKQNPACVYTCSSHINSQILPNVQLKNTVIESIPAPFNTVHSSICVNHRMIPLRYRDVLAETGTIMEADVDMLQRMRRFILQKVLNSYLITTQTCFHLLEKH